MGTIIEDLYDHEGYGARRLPDETLTGTWSTETAKFEAYVASCGCGWHGGEHPPTEDGYDAALDEWEAEHARPLLAETVPPSVSMAVKDAQQAIGRLARQRPDAARRAVDEMSVWCDHLRRRLEPATVESGADRMRHRLDALSRRDHGRTLGL